MPKLAQSIAPILPFCAAGEIAQDEGLATAMPDGNKALFVNAKAKKQPIQAYLAKSQPFIVEAAPLALARPKKSQRWSDSWLQTHQATCRVPSSMWMR